MKHQAVRAVYDKGILRPKRLLPLEDQEEVLILVIPLREKEQVAPDPHRLTVLRERVETWLAQQPPDAVRPSLYSPEAPDRAFDQVLAAIRARASRFSDEEIATDVRAALAEARCLSPKEQAELDTEVDSLLAELAIIAES